MVEDSEERPWEQPDAVRRDCEPHRAELLVWTGRAAMYLGALSGPLAFCIFALDVRYEWFALPAVLAAAGIRCGMIVRTWACSDLAEMEAGRMDPAGYPRTLTAQGNAGAALGFGWCGLFFAGVGSLR